MNKKDFSCTVKIGESLESKLQSYIETHKILLKSSFHKSLLKGIDSLTEVVDLQDKGLKQLPEAYNTWVTAWNALYAEKDEKLKEFGMKKEFLLSGKKKFETKVYPALLKASEEFSALSKKISLLAEKVRLKDKVNTA